MYEVMILIQKFDNRKLSKTLPLPFPSDHGESRSAVGHSVGSAHAANIKQLVI